MRKRQNVNSKASTTRNRALLFETLTQTHTIFTHTLSLNHSHFTFAHAFSPSTHSLQITVQVHKVLCSLAVGKLYLIPSVSKKWQKTP